mgnify:CR=1 FL=1
MSPSLAQEDVAKKLQVIIRKLQKVVIDRSCNLLGSRGIQESL